MGIVINQSFKNTLTTYVGFAIGAINTLFLYTYFLTDTYYGLVSYLIAIANLMTPLLSFGVHNTLVKYFSSYTSQKEQQRFTTLMFFMPLFTIIPIGFVGIFGYRWIAALLSTKNELLETYLWMTYIIAFSMAYFEVFYAWAKVHLASVFGNILKELFHRIGIMALLFAIFMEWIDLTTFIYGLMFLYLTRMLLMFFGALYVKKPKMSFKRPENIKSVMRYAAVLMLSGSVSIVLLDIDTFMIGQFKALNNVAFYNVAVFIAMVIIVPSRAMHQIIYPITAKLLNTKNTIALKDIYQRSALNLYIIGSLIFLLIIANIGELYKLLPPQYSNGIHVVFFIALAKLSDTLLGNNNAIIFNSKYYIMILIFGCILAVITVSLNLLFIPLWGIEGAAIATLLAFLSYNTAKIGFVYVKFRIHPFCHNTLKTTGLLILGILLFYFWDFASHPLVNILLKSTIIGVFYSFIVLKFKLSKDLFDLAQRYLFSSR